MFFLTNLIDSNVFWIVLWVGIFLFALVIEFCTEQLVSIWFSGAALISLILSIFNVYWWLQIIIFILCSIILVAVSRTFVSKVLQKDIKTNSDSLINNEILVLKPTKKHLVGEGKIRDITWSIITDDEEIINEGDYAIITSIEGNKLHVKRKE